jgi:hypothetical protein
MVYRNAVNANHAHTYHAAFRTSLLYSATQCLAIVVALRVQIVVLDKAVVVVHRLGQRARTVC